MSLIVKSNGFQQMYLQRRGPLAFVTSSALSLSETSPAESIAASAVTRRTALIQGILQPVHLISSISAIAAATTTTPQLALASYGSSSRMEFPSYIDFLIEKNQQVDAGTFLYKGVDTTTILERLVSARTRLVDIAPLAQQGKWSQVQGVLTGPLGTLGQTLSLLAANDKKALAAAKIVKQDVVEIGQAAAKKDVEGCTKSADQAIQDLEAFVKTAVGGSD